MYVSCLCSLVRVLLHIASRVCMHIASVFGCVIPTQAFPSPVQQLQQRTWFLHWSLFVFFNHTENRPLLVDYFTHEQYMNVIQTSCPHLLRYLVAAAVMHKSRRRTLLHELVAIIEQEVYALQLSLSLSLPLFMNFRLCSGKLGVI